MVVIILGMDNKRSTGRTGISGFAGGRCPSEISTAMFQGDHRILPKTGVVVVIKGAKKVVRPTTVTAIANIILLVPRNPIVGLPFR